MPNNYVSYDAQTPSENEKVQARQNIGAMGLNSFDLYMNGAVPRPPVPPFFTQRIPNIVPGYTEFELINGLNHALLIEQTARQNTDLLLKENLEKETADRIQADNQLQENIDAEATARENADNQLQQNITAEATARENADTTLQNNINAEKTARENADTSLQQAITDETTARQKDTETVMGEIAGIKGREYRVVTVTTDDGIEFKSSMTGQEIYNLLQNNIQLLFALKLDNELIITSNPTISIISNNTALFISNIVNTPDSCDVQSLILPISDNKIFIRVNPINIKEIKNNVSTLQGDVTNLQGEVVNFVSATEIQNFTEEQKARARANIGAGTGGGTAAGAVLYDQAQSLTEEQKAQARTNIGAGTGGSADGAVLYDQEQSLNDYQKLTARKNIGAISGQYLDNSGTHPMNIISSNNSNNNFNITIGGFSLRRSLSDKVSLSKLQNFSDSEGWVTFEQVYGIAPTDTKFYNLILGKLFLTINGEPTFTYPNNDLTAFANSTGANAGNAVKRFFSGTLNITEAANVTTACDVLEMYFLPFKTSDVAGNSGSLNYKIVLKVREATDGASHQVGDIITLYNKLWDKNYVSISGSVEA